MAGAATIAKQYFKARKDFELRGMAIHAGDVIDLAQFDLPIHRAVSMENARMGSLIADASSVRDREFSSPPPPPPTASPVVEEITPVLEAPPSEDLPTSVDVDGPDETELGGWTEQSLGARFTIAARRELCKKFGLTVRGNKAEVIARLLDYQNSQEE